MAANVRDAAYLLMAMSAHDPADPASPQEPGRFGRDYAAALKADGLRGKRIGVVRSLAGFHEGVDARFEQAISDLRSAGAEIVDQLSVPEEPAGLADAAYEVLLHEFKHDLNAYLAGLPGAAGSLRLHDLIGFNLQQADVELKWFQQEIFLQAQQRGDLQSPVYQDALALTRNHSRGAIDGLLQAHALDLLVSPTDAPAWVIDLVVGDRFLGGSSSLPARAGYPHITVPMGYVHGLPVGLSFFGAAYAEEILIEAAYAYEQATRHAKPPEGFGDWRAAVTPR
jgi:Asp-tRNA(Asn)/Glu-tRNA(Gln) amidotransferase A subunit family amidase